MIRPALCESRSSVSGAMRSDGFGALRLVFDDRKLGFVTNVYWFHRRYAGEYEPRPQQPRGWYVFGGYD
ncbi:MAG: hypothetical protein FJ382_14790, partial [Verrucomicrobia bacterium]|nr:hypothetical protein [Verrucomicrobiota bacterium]